ncbi:MAG: dTDP-4-dehydrorhamnose reductase [Thermodesulfobacteriota bacterium]
MRVFITGAFGQLGSEIERAFEGSDFFLGGRSESDITNQGIIKTIVDFEPDLVIHTAAFTDVDGCEIKPDKAFKVNAFGTRNVAVGAEKAGAKLIYISTDYVFDGKSDEPYDEFSGTNPINVYGMSKLGGEEFIKHLSRRFFIVRSSWLYGKTGKNFVKTILNIAREKDELRVVNDQRGAPTYVKDLAEMISKIARTEAYGLYHASGGGYCTWYEFALEILRLADIKKEVVPTSSSELNRPAPRPANSALTSIALKQIGIEPRQWKEAIKEFMADMES